jgi:hypothetical protein
MTEGFGMSRVAEDARALKAERDARRFATDRLAGGVFVGREREVDERAQRSRQPRRSGLALLPGSRA